MARLTPETATEAVWLALNALHADDGVLVDGSIADLGLGEVLLPWLDLGGTAASDGGRGLLRILGSRHVDVGLGWAW
jgi:hypothetical protein